MILQIKTGKIDVKYFQGKFGVDVRQEFAEAYAGLVDEGFAEIKAEEITLTRPGLLRADSLLSRFFEPQFRGIRYT
jgi:oxygen-independent coproporphyrinogen-3 oxidase